MSSGLPEGVQRVTVWSGGCRNRRVTDGYLVLTERDDDARCMPRYAGAVYLDLADARAAAFRASMRRVVVETVTGMHHRYLVEWSGGAVVYPTEAAARAAMGDVAQLEAAVREAAAEEAP